MAGMERIGRLGVLPQPFSREDYLAIVLNPDFLAHCHPRERGNSACIGDVHRGAGRSSRTQRGPAHAAAEAERARIQRIFGRYVPAQVAEQLIHAGQLAPQQREASIIFADIEGFTQLANPCHPLTSSHYSTVSSARRRRSSMTGRSRRLPCRRCVDRSVNAPRIDAHSVRAVDAVRAVRLSFRRN